MTLKRYILTLHDYIDLEVPTLCVGTESCEGLAFYVEGIVWGGRSETYLMRIRSSIPYIPDLAYALKCYFLMVPGFISRKDWLKKGSDHIYHVEFHHDPFRYRKMFFLKLTETLRNLTKEKTCHH